MGTLLDREVWDVLGQEGVDDMLVQGTDGEVLGQCGYWTCWNREGMGRAAGTGRV